MTLLLTLLASYVGLSLLIGLVVTVLCPYPNPLLIPVVAAIWPKWVWDWARDR